MTRYLQPSISNGIPREQALIRRWWHEQHDARGRIVWEYFLEGSFVDAILFLDAPTTGDEKPGKDTARLFPLGGQRVVVCEAKATLTPELIGQTLVYSEFARRAGAKVLEAIALAEAGFPQMQDVARKLGLTVVISPLGVDSEPVERLGGGKLLDASPHTTKQAGRQASGE